MVVSLESLWVRITKAKYKFDFSGINVGSRRGYDGFGMEFWS